MKIKFRNPLPPLPEVAGPAWREWILLGLTLLAVYFACVQPLWDPDSYWHLAVGREIWQTHHLVRTETFSFSAHGVPWEDTEWLFHLLVFGLWKIFGYKGLAVFTGLMGSLIAFSLYRVVRLAGIDTAGFSIYMVLLLPVFRERIRMRPDVFSLLFMAVLVEILMRWKPGREKIGKHWIGICIVFLLWAQFHAGWSYGIALFGVYLAGEVLDSLREKNLTWGYFLKLSLCGLSSILVLFVNPYGWRIPWFPVKSLVGFNDPSLVQIVEWNSTPLKYPYIILFSVELIIAVALFISWRKLTWRRLLWFSSQVFLGFYWIRYVAYAVVGLAPFGGWSIKKLYRRPLPRKAIWITALVITAWSSFFYYANITREVNLTGKFPVQETAFLVKNKISGNLYNTYVVGGYLDWYAYPLDRVFMDGRYYPFAETLKEYWTAHKTVDEYLEFLDKYDFNIALYPYPDFKLKGKNYLKGSQRRGPTTVIFPRKDWALVYFGNYGMVLLKRDSRYSGVIEKREYRALRPDDLEYLVWAARKGLVDREDLEKEIRRGIEENPWLKRKGSLKKALGQLEEDNSID